MKCRVCSIYRGEGMANEPSLMKKVNGLHLMWKGSKLPLRKECRPPSKAFETIKHAPGQ